MLIHQPPRFIYEAIKISLAQLPYHCGRNVSVYIYMDQCIQMADGVQSVRPSDDRSQENESTD